MNENIKETAQQYEKAGRAVSRVPGLPGYGAKLSEKIRETTTDYSKINDFERFVLDEGWRYETDEALRAGYDRRWKCAHGIALSEEEFFAETGEHYDFKMLKEEFIAQAGEHYDSETLKEVYSVLTDMVQEKKLSSADIYRYAHYRWCLHDPDAIVAYQEGRDKWLVNNCSTKITTDRAIIEVNSEWGFEASKIKIIGTPYYDATDWQYIRFDCACMTWLWQNGNLYQVYE